MSDKQMKTLIICLFGTILLCCIILVIAVFSYHKKSESASTGELSIKRTKVYEVLDDSTQTTSEVTNDQDENGWEENRVSSNVSIGEVDESVEEDSTKETEEVTEDAAKE